MVNAKLIEHHFREALKRHRKDRGWTQAQLEKELAQRKIHLHWTSIAKIEKGDRAVKIDEAAAIAEVFGVSVDALLGTQPPDDTTLTYALANLTSYAGDCQRQIRQAQGIAADITEQVEDDLVERFDFAALPELQRTARGLVTQLKRAATVAARLTQIASYTIAEEGKQ